jgi:phosphate transport system substrate-binding protein
MTMLRSSLLALAVLLLLAVNADARERIIVCGTGDSQTLLRLLAGDYQDRHPDARIEVPDSIGSSGGVRATAEGDCDLGRTARPLKEREKPFGLHYREFAYSPVVFLTNPSVRGVDGLTTRQVVGILSGEIDDWAELGGAPGKIYVAKREPGDSSRTVLEKVIPALARIEEWAGKTIYSTPETIDTILRYPGTLGFAPLAMVRGTDLQVLKLDGVAPNEENLASGRYPAFNPFALVWKGELSGVAADFGAFLHSPRARRLITEYGAYPPKERP